MVGSELAALGATILLTVVGVPSVYYGDEQALRGTKRKGLGGDDAVRPTLDDGGGGADIPPIS